MSRVIDLNSLSPPAEAAAGWRIAFRICFLLAVLGFVGFMVLLAHERKDGFIPDVTLLPGLTLYRLVVYTAIASVFAVIGCRWIAITTNRDLLWAKNPGRGTGR